MKEITFNSKETGRKLSSLVTPNMMDVLSSLVAKEGENFSLLLGDQILAVCPKRDKKLYGNFAIFPMLKEAMNFVKLNVL